MFNIYLFCAIVGGALMLLSFAFGDSDCSLNTDLNTDGVWVELPFFSLRFWTFGGGMFGITGLILTLAGRPFLTTLIGALITGLVTGWTLTGILRQLHRRTPNSLITPDDLIGATGTIELPCDSTQPGKVRLALKGQQVEYLARTPSPTPLALGETVVVVDVQGQWVEVIPQGVDKSETSLLD